MGTGPLLFVACEADPQTVGAVIGGLVVGLALLGFPLLVLLLVRRMRQRVIEQARRAGARDDDPYDGCGPLNVG